MVYLDKIMMFKFLFKDIYQYKMTKLTTNAHLHP